MATPLSIPRMRSPTSSARKRETCRHGVLLEQSARPTSMSPKVLVTKYQINKTAKRKKQKQAYPYTARMEKRRLQRPRRPTPQLTRLQPRALVPLLASQDLNDRTNGHRPSRSVPPVTFSPTILLQPWWWRGKTCRSGSGTPGLGVDTPKREKTVYGKPGLLLSSGITLAQRKSGSLTPALGCRTQGRRWGGHSPPDAAISSFSSGWQPRLLQVETLVDALSVSSFFLPGPTPVPVRLARFSAAQETGQVRCLRGECTYARNISAGH